jgi:hypothetical protein
VKRIIQIVGVVFITGGWAFSANAQEVNMVSIGNFSTGATNVIGGVESYVVECSERTFLCEDNFSNIWNFADNLPDTRIRLCEQDINVASAQNCVHTMEIHLQLAQIYRESIIELQRFFCGRQEVYLDGDFIGRIRGDASGTGIPMNVEYTFGLLTPGKTHIFVITAPDNIFAECSPEANQVISMNGFAIKGVPH